MAPKGYTTRGLVENYLLITVDPSFHTQVDRWIESIEAYIENVTGRVFVGDGSPESAELIYDGDGTNELFVDDFRSISEITIDDGDPLVLGDDYYLYPANTTVKNRIVLVGQVFTRGNQNVKITGIWGSSDIPADIEFAATVLVAGIINFSDQAEGEVQSMSIGSYSVTYKTESQKEDFTQAKEILKLNKRYGTF